MSERKRIKAPLGETVTMAAALVVIAAVIIGMTIWSLQATKKSSEQSTDTLSTFYLEELMGQRAQMLEDSLDRNFGYLDHVVSGLDAESLQSQASARSFLSEMEELYDVDKIGLVSESGLVYTAHSTFSDASRYTDLQGLDGPQVIASNVYGAKKQVVLAAPVSDRRLEGESLVACFMQIDMDDVVGSLNRAESGSEGTTFMGLYLRNGDNLTSSSLGDIEAGTNLLSFVESAQLADGQTADAIEQSFRSGGQGLITFDYRGDREYIYYTPMGDAGWMLTVLIRDNTIENLLDQTTESMAQRSILQMVLSALVIVVIFGIVLYLSRKNGAMRVRQHELEIRAENEAALKEAYEEARRARGEAEAANRAKSTFLFNMPHDIRTPMNAILGFSRMMEKELDDPEALAGHLGKVRESGEYLLSLINNVLDMARIESGKMELDEKAIDLVAENSGDMHMFGADVSAKGLTFASSVDITHRFVYADQSKLRQIAVNLIGNAVKYTPEGGKVSVHLAEVPCVQEGCASYEFVVSDTGIGMEKEFQQQIFDLFSRERTSTESKVNGTGLGMSIVKRLVDLMGGTIEIDSAPGEGSTFTVGLTFKIAPEAPLSEQEQVPAEPAAFAGKRVLLAEDNELNAEIAMEILGEYGLEVDHARDGRECVDMLVAAEPGRYDLVLMDIQMPRLNGYDATREIRGLSDGDKASVPIVAMTANAFEEDRQNALAAGMNGHVAKPIDTDELLRSISRFVRG